MKACVYVALIFSKSHTIYFLCSCMYVYCDLSMTIAVNIDYIENVHPKKLYFVNGIEAKERVRHCERLASIQPVERL